MQKDKSLQVPSKLGGAHQATVLAIAGKQQLEITLAGDYVVISSDGYFTDWITFYNHSATWVCDGIFPFSKGIKDALDLLARNHHAEFLTKAWKAA